MTASMMHEESDDGHLSQKHTFQSENYDHHCGTEGRNDESPKRNGGQHGTT